jgi:hypothetical protein
VDLDLPVANLPALVREQLPNAVHVERVKPAAAGEEPRAVAGVRSAEELFASFYRRSNGRGREPSAATLSLFRRLLDEETSETADA